MLGFMSVNVLLSMWISDSGVTAMLIPIVEAVIDELFDDVEQQGISNGLDDSVLSMNSIQSLVGTEKQDQSDR